MNEDPLSVNVGVLGTPFVSSSLPAMDALGYNSTFSFVES